MINLKLNHINKTQPTKKEIDMNLINNPMVILPEMVKIPGSTISMGKYPVTFDEFDYFCSEIKTSKKPKDNGWGRGKRPVINVNKEWSKWSWEGRYHHNAKEYCQWLSEQTGRVYRLPSEAEWEYACRANVGDLEWERLTRKCGWTGTNEDEWVYVEYTGENRNENKSHTVGTVWETNAFGLCDMNGNVWEWVENSEVEEGRGITRGQFGFRSGVSRREYSLRGVAEYGAVTGFRVVCESGSCR